jgi:hypothetical protein
MTPNNNMRRSRASNLKSAAEILGLVAVVLGLLFVGIEVRQNTAAIHAETLQGLNDSSQEFLLLLASNPALVEIQLKAVTDPTSLNAIEEQQFSYLERTRWLRSQNAYFQHQRGTLGDADWETYARLLCGRQQSYWQAHESVLAEEFVNFVESTCKWQ